MYQIFSNQSIDLKQRPNSNSPAARSSMVSMFVVLTGMPKGVPVFTSGNVSR